MARQLVADGEDVRVMVRANANTVSIDDHLNNHGVTRFVGDIFDTDTVRAFSSGKLAHYKIPRYVHIVEEFPMTVTGKVRKVDMRAESNRLLGL